MKQYLPSMREITGDLEAVGLGGMSPDVRSLSLFLRILGERTARDNLIGPREMERIWPRHVLESLCYALLLDRRRRVVDVGTGAGFPGLVLALSGFEVTMLEPRRKRFLFLRHVLRRLGRDEEMVRRARVEDVELSASGVLQFVCRAVGPVEKVLGQVCSAFRGDAVLVYRAPREVASDLVEAQVRLPSPPLDRSGVLVQYRIPKNRPGRADHPLEEQ